MADDTADNWEELENGEDLDRKLDKLVQPDKKKDQSVPVQKLQEDTAGRTAYQPTIKILKREVNNTQNNCIVSDRTPSKPIRTYEEREAAYAEARLRILGAAVNPEEDLLQISSVGSESGFVKSDLSISPDLPSSSSNTSSLKNDVPAATVPR